MSLYLDPSVIVPLFVQEDTTLLVHGFLSQAEDPLLVNEFAAAEVASAISRLVRMEQLSAEAGRGALTHFDTWRASETRPAAIDEADFRVASGIVRQFQLKLRTPDALHIAICFRLGATMVSFDGLLVAGAQALGIAVRTPRG